MGIRHELYCDKCGSNKDIMHLGRKEMEYSGFTSAWIEYKCLMCGFMFKQTDRYGDTGIGISEPSPNIIGISDISKKMDD